MSLTMPISIEMVAVIHNGAVRCRIQYMALPQHAVASVRRNDWAELEVPFDVLVAQNG